jgi:hypothetical protein
MRASGVFSLRRRQDQPRGGKQEKLQICGKIATAVNYSRVFPEK